MTMKPKARKFRLRRGAPLSEGLKNETVPSPARQPDTQSTSKARKVEDGFGDQEFPTAKPTKRRVSKPNQPENTVDAIKAEGLTGRQLRLARRVAQRHGLTPQSDYEAVKLLRDKGIDPFEKGAMLELVVPEGQKSTAIANPKQNLPQSGSNATPPPRPEPLDEATRAAEIFRIQRDLAHRRRRKLAMLWARLSAFVLLPTILVGYYFYAVATPLYATKTEFLIQQANSNGGGGGLGGLFSGTGFATSQDSITVQSYLQSRDAMLRLDSEIGFKEHFSGDNIDFLRRLSPGATNEEAYRLYQKMVKIGYDPTEGIMKMEVIAADPQISEEMSRALLKYAEEQVDNLTQRLREDQMKGSRESFDEAEGKMVAAQQKVLELQERLGVIDAASEASAIMSQVSIFETQLQEKKLQLQQLLDNAGPNQARVDGVKGDIERLETVIADLRANLTQSGTDSASLASISGELRLAQLELETRTALMQQALQQLETSRIEANRQVRYLSMGVTPVAPDEPTYPRAFENTAVSLLLFAGIYLLMSLTASILREQVSA